ncbi:MAG: hypothetical protein M1823_000934 [Watsoniomyces obsoletus]|nr:MAG: hypothetical protein M1823_000934 [Watsoniomyces obsoletus]
MRALLSVLAGLLACAARASAYEQRIDEKDENRQRCAGMYSRKTWGGAVNPFILLAFDRQPVEGDDDPIVSTVIYEWKDEPLVGRYPDPDAIGKEYICHQENVQKKLCNDTQIGQFIISPNATAPGKTSIITQALHVKEAPPINYPITRTGYYCVGTFGYSAEKYQAIVTFRNAYGELPGSQIAKLPFYGGLTIVYAVIGLFWAFLYVQNRRDILPVQNYITAIIVFLIVEMAMTWGFYDYQNRHGLNVGANVLMVIASVLNAGRNSFSFFLLLIVCLGYGVVKPSLGKTMLLVRGLAGTHFIFGVIYALASLAITPESAGPLVLLVILPLSATLTAFYVWTLNALKLTIKDLEERKQTVKAKMYKKLWWCLVASILVIFGFFFVNSFSFAGHKNPDFVPENWKTRWFLLDGWLNLVYLVDLAFIAYLWRPTVNNRRFAMSDEIAQDEEGFEVASFGGSLDEEEGGSGNQTPRGPNTDGTNDRSQPNPNPSSGTNHQPSSNCLQKSTTTSSAKDDPRESFDAEPIFAVGEEDGDAEQWSEDDDDDDQNNPTPDSSEKKRLTGKDD